MNHNIYVVDQTQYLLAVNRCNNLYNDLLNFMNNYSYKNKIKITYENKYYFKVVRIDTQDGFQVCVYPQTMKMCIYLIINGKKNIQKSISILNSDDLNNFIKNSLMFDHYYKDNQREIYRKLVIAFSNFNITNGNHIISMTDNTNNGYYIYFDMESYAKIGLIIDNKYFNINSKSVDNILEIVSELNSMIEQNIHNQTKYYNVIDPKYIDYIEDTESEQNYNSLNSSFEDPINDPV